MHAQITKPITIHHFLWDGCEFPNKDKHCTKPILTQPTSQKELLEDTNTWGGQEIFK
jgi:hypothetical protein